VLAQGGMATVWLARLQGKHGFEKLVAVKTILPSFAAEAQFQQMFLDEARIASLVDHPNVAHILDLGEHNGVLYLVMELVDGDPLQKLHKAVEKDNLRIPIGITLRLMSDACAGLDAAHTLRSPDGQHLNVVHRDVSPQNVLVTASGVAKVIDFGIAKAKNRIADDTTSGTLKGKVQYMAREQAVGGIVDARADLWAAGAIIYYLVMGRSPYQEANSIATLQALLNKAPIPRLPDSIPAPVRALVEKSLEHDVSQRFQSGAEMRDAIDRAIVDARLMTSHAQVGAFVKEYLGARIANRKKAIENALQEAQKRVRSEALAAPLDAPEVQTGSGVHRPAELTQQLTDPTSSGPRSLTPVAAFRAAFEAPLPSAPMPPVAEKSATGSGPYPQQHASSSGPWPQQPPDPAPAGSAWQPQPPPGASVDAWQQSAADRSGSNASVAPTLAPPARASAASRTRRRRLRLVLAILFGVTAGYGGAKYALQRMERARAKPAVTHAAVDLPPPTDSAPGAPSALSAPSASQSAHAPGAAPPPRAASASAPEASKAAPSPRAPAPPVHKPPASAPASAPAAGPTAKAGTPKNDDYGF
jgi:eukaryotic-like serine/threonine-protein kinase